MASFGIASNTAWSFFMDRDNGIFYEMLTYPMRRADICSARACSTWWCRSSRRLSRSCSPTSFSTCRSAGSRCRCLRQPSFIGTAGWFFFYAIFALVIRGNDVFNTVTSIFYFVLLFASSMFYPVEPLPTPLRQLSWANPITWHVDVLRYATIGLGDPSRIWLESAAFLVFTAAFAGALLALRRQ